METNELIDGLINEEFSDVSIYTGEARLFTDKLVGGVRIAETFAAFAKEETEHAYALMKIIGKTEGIQSRKIEVGTSLRKCLEMHIRRETTAITIYKKLLAMLTAPEHKMIIKGIIAQETEHLRAARDYFIKIRAANE